MVFVQHHGPERSFVRVKPFDRRAEGSDLFDDALIGSLM
jgi:hypothetical protein